MVEFRPFPKIPRLTRGITVTEKIDGTNAAVVLDLIADTPNHPCSIATCGDYILLAQSRSRFITPDNDNFGFASWVKANAEELTKLGAGLHFGEWWGVGIQRGYGLFERRFSLFNAYLWRDPETRPACCEVVPTLYSGPMDEARVNGALMHLKASGSVAAPGFMNPEGIIVFHQASGQLFKKTDLGVDGSKESK